MRGALVALREDAPLPFALDPRYMSPKGPA